MNHLFYGNEQAVQTLAFAVKSGRLSHAYLMYGASGIGKKTFCLWFAQSILCQGENKPCGVCSSCKKVEKNFHPDLKILGGDSAKNSFHADVVRSIRTDAYIRPNESEFKIYILNQVDTMSAAAANSLLKILEEPPKHVIFLLCCENRMALLETVRSRCIAVPLFPVSDKQCFEALSDRLPEEDGQKLKQAAVFADGIIGRGLAFLQDAQAQQSTALADGILQSLTKPHELASACSFAPLEGNRALTLLTLDALLSLFEQTLHAKMNGVPDAGQAVQQVAQSMTLKRLLHAIDRVQTAKNNLERNANLGLTLTWLSSALWAH